ncbi:universal stress protein [Natronococcus pandeyae]|uniref:Universal stress protein n=1 Tax=Natronococcus pandeyae TaxID=2055836 RepID=A0A8J8PZ77_9EURY|nr:universal stress protein [Natronococcus pandeyae]TYL36496.1 universal stress protein [Natronococcus pandeyae]
MYDRILIPTDGSDVAVAAAETGFAFARRFDSTLHAVHVLDDGDPDRGDQLVTAVEEASVDLDIETTTAVLEESPSVHDTIVDYVRDNEIDCVVMGTHGTAHPDRPVLGSVAERTIRTAPVPVVTVNEQTVPPSVLETVLVPTDGSEHALEAAGHGTALAANVGASLHIVNVVRLRLDDLTETVEEREERGREAIDEVIDVASRAGVSPVEASLLTGVPYQSIVDYVRTHDVDLVVMGTHGRTGVGRHFIGSVTERVMRRADVPVVAVKDDEQLE